MTIPELDRKRIEAWCRARTPDEHRDTMRVEAMFRGNSVNVADRRAPWPDSVGPEWSTLRIAKLTLDPVTQTWKLYSLDRHDRLMPYSDEFGLSGRLVDLLDEIDRDPISIFWG